MPKIAKVLAPVEVRRLSEPGHYPVGGVAGLALQITPTGSKSWTLRVTVGSKRRDLGLGPYPEVSLADAREKAKALREQIRQGVDPVTERTVQREALAKARAVAMTFIQAAEAKHEIVGAGLKNVKYRAQWMTLVRRYCAPIAEMNVADIKSSHVADVLRPHWATKLDSMRKLRAQIEIILDYAIAAEKREGPNPAIWKGAIESLLTDPKRLKVERNFEAMPYKDVPAFMVQLRSKAGTSARCLEWAILNASRSGEARGAMWSELDLNAKTWTIPGSRMKAGQEHVVPLTEITIQFLRELPRLDPKLLFPSSNTGKALSDMALLGVMRRMGLTAVPHGFRSAFADWASEETHHTGEVREMALAHKIKSKVERAYRRGDLLEKRRELMNDWHQYLAGGA